MITNSSKGCVYLQSLYTMYGMLLEVMIFEVHTLLVSKSMKHVVGSETCLRLVGAFISKTKESFEANIVNV